MRKLALESDVKVYNCATSPEAHRSSCGHFHIVNFIVTA